MVICMPSRKALNNQSIPLTVTYLNLDKAFSHIPRFNLKEPAKKNLTECSIISKCI